MRLALISLLMIPLVVSCRSDDGGKSDSGLEADADADGDPDVHDGHPCVPEHQLQPDSSISWSRSQARASRLGSRSWSLSSESQRRSYARGRHSLWVAQHAVPLCYDFA